jgi:hypothetical protein
MRSIGRESELKAVMAEVSRRLDVDGKLVERGLGGRQVHISVSAPHLGGLSLFLEDIRDELALHRGVLPILQHLEKPNEPDADFDAILKTLAEHGGGPIEGAGIAPLFAACDKVWKDRHLLPVLILDASSAIDQIQSVEALRHAAVKSPLLQRLRILGTAMEDQEPKLVVIVGWHDNFPTLSSAWRAQDIVQRFFPSIVLWPDFQNENPWPIFRQILEPHFTVEDDYPGFCRAGIPVGAVIARGKEKKKAAIDGALLYDLLRNKGEIPTEVRNLRSDTVIALCLQDAQIGEGHPLVGHVRSPAFRPYVEVTENGYVANEDLYSALGLRPRHVIVARDRQIRNRFEEADAKLADELAQAIPSVVNAPGEVVTRDTYSVCELQPLPTWTEGRPIRVTALVSLNRTVPSELRTEIVSRLKAIEADPVSRGRDLLVFVHRDQGLGAQLTRSVLAEESFEPRTFAVREGRVPVPKAVALASVEIDVEHVIEGIVAKLDPALGAKRFRDQLANAVKRHFRQAAESYPSFSKQILECPALPMLIGDARRWRRTGENLSAKDVDSLVALKVLERRDSDDAVRWSYSGDGFLANVLAGISDATPLRDYLSERYLYDVASWPSIAPAIASAWCDYLTLDRGELRVKPAGNALSRRVAALEQAVESSLGRLEAFGAVPELAEFVQDLKRLNAKRKKANANELESICDDLINLESRATKATETWQGKRQERRVALVASLEKLKKARSRDTALESRRVAVLADAERFVGNEDGAYSEANTLVDEVDELLGQIDAADRQREANSRAMQRIRQQLEALNGRVGKLELRIDALSERQGYDKLAIDLKSAASGLAAIDTMLRSLEKRDESSAEQGQALSKLNAELAQLEFTLSEIGERVARLERKPSSTKPPPATVAGTSSVHVTPKPVTSAAQNAAAAAGTRSNSSSSASEGSGSRLGKPPSPPSGASPSGASPSGASPSGASPNAAPSGASPNAAPSGASPSEASPGEASPSEAASSGASPSGQGPMPPGIQTTALISDVLEQPQATPIPQPEPPPKVATARELRFGNTADDLDRLADLVATDIRIVELKVES